MFDFFSFPGGIGIHDGKKAVSIELHVYDVRKISKSPFSAGSIVPAKVYF